MYLDYPVGATCYSKAMRLTVLVDNCAIIDRYYLAEPAFSCLLEHGGRRVLLDAGYSDAFLRNADAMGMDLATVDAVVLSHGHDDHSGGLPLLAKRIEEVRPAEAPPLGETSPLAYGLRPLLVAHPRAFDPRRYEGLSIGSPASLDELSAAYEPRLSAEPVDLGGGFLFLGQIPRRNDAEAKEPIGEVDGPDGTAPDYLLDDSAVAWRGEEGLVVVSGCSHAGIVNIVERAVELTGETRIVDVVGGFHLLGASRARLDFTAERLAALGPLAVHPCHCTDLAAKLRLAASLPVEELGVSRVLEYR